MARHKNASWHLSDPAARWEEVQVAVLMDIRDELQRLNSLLHCSNFMNMPHTLRTISTNTRRRKRKATIRRSP